jgi:selenocysteine-specific translation elongation factor
MLIVANKSDLVSDKIELERRVKLVEAMASSVYPALRGVIPVSASRGEGLEELRCRIATLLRGMGASTC